MSTASPDLQHRPSLSRSPSPVAPRSPSNGGLRQPSPLRTPSPSSSSYSFGESADRTPDMSRTRTRTGGIDFGQPLVASSDLAPPPSLSPNPPRTSSSSSGIPKPSSGPSTISAASRRKSSVQTWMDQSTLSGPGGRKPSWGMGAAGGASMWGPSSGSAGPSPSSSRTASVSQAAGRFGPSSGGAGMSNRGARQGSVASTGSQGARASSTGGPASSHSRSSVSQGSSSKARHADRRISTASSAPSVNTNRLSSHSMSSASGQHPYANPAHSSNGLLDPGQATNRWYSRSSYTPGSGNKRFSTASAGALVAPYTVYQPQVSVKSDVLHNGEPGFGDRWEGDGSEGDQPKTSPSRTSEETASLASFNSTSEDDLLKQEALRRPSWVSIRLPSFASAATSRSNSTAGTITNGLSPKLGMAKSPPTSPRLEYDGTESFDLQESMREVLHQQPPPNARSKSSPTLPMSSSSFARAAGKKPSPILTSAPFAGNTIVSPHESTSGPPLPPKGDALQIKQRTLSNISEMSRQPSTSSGGSGGSGLPALPARSPLRARRDTAGSPTPSQGSFTTANDSEMSSADEGGRSTGPGEFGESEEGVDASTVRQRRSSRNRPKTADDTMVTTARWSTTDGPVRAMSQFTAADEGAVWLDDDGEEKRRMSRSRPASTASRSGLVGGLRQNDPNMRKKREARVISVEEEEAVAAAAARDADGKSYGDLSRGPDSAAQPHGPIETTRSPSLPLHAATTVIPDLQLPQITTGTTVFPSLKMQPSGGAPKSPSGSLSAHHHPTHQRSNSQPLPMLSASPHLSPAPITSKRAHLLHEISTTERSYAQDLGLVRDAYLFRIRPTSVTESTTGGESSTTQVTSTGSNRSSMATYDTARTSVEGTDDGRADRKSKISTNSAEQPFLGNEPAGNSTISLSGTSERSSTNTPKMTIHSNTSNSSSANFAPPSPRPVTMISQNSFGSNNRPSTPIIQCPLSPADIRAVFLNLESVATLAHEFASLLETACTPAAEEAGSDMIGEIFLTMMPRIRQAYASYCPRQAGAHARFLELLVDRRYTGYFAECWQMIQPHTNSWDLPSMLIKPVQRVLKYPLLLEDLLKQTPASHPDHANLKRASGIVRALADEINEIKRRKDTVDSIMHRGREAPGSATSGTQSGRDKNKRSGVMTAFRKERARAGAGASTATAAAMSFTASSHEDLRKTETAYAALVSRLMTAETTAKRLGKSVASTGPKARESWHAQRKALDSWRRIINLGGLEPVEDIRIEAFRTVVEKVIAGPCVLMDQELAAEIVPSFIKLFNICKGPRKVILKRNANHEDYNRVIITKARGGDIEKLPQEVLEGAQVFVALHHQLLAELPPLLEGFATILDMVLKALAACHARFHRGVQDLLNGFWNEFPPVVMDVDSESAHVSSDGPAIIRVWEEASRVPTEMVEELAITRKISVRLMDAPVRLASGSTHQIHEGIVDQRGNGYAGLSPRPNGGSSRASPGLTRQLTSSSRHSTLNSPSDKLAPVRLSKLDPYGADQYNHARPISPNILPERTSSARSIPQRRVVDDIDRHSASSLASIGPALSQMSFEGSDASNHERFAESVINRLSYAQDDGANHIRLSSYENDLLPGARHAARRDPHSPSYDRSFAGGASDATPTRAASVATVPIPDDVEEDGVEWDELGADAEVLYRCECVADFDLQGLDLQYMGQRFLKIGRGDVVEILYEVGRVDELEEFPLDVGLEDDGLLIGKDGTGAQGFVLCSFLHPIFDEEEA